PRPVDERGREDGMRREPYGVIKNQVVVRQFGQRETTDADVAAVLARVVVLERELVLVARHQVEPSPPEPVTLTRGHKVIEGSFRLQRVDDAYRAIVVDRAGEQVRSLPEL